MRKIHILYALLATLFLVGCGGGGSGSSGSTAPPGDSSPTPPIQTFIVSTSAGQGGSINPSTATVQSGTASVFTLVPDTGYRVDSATGCGGVLSGNAYTTGPITSTCTVSAAFVLNTYSVTTSAGPGGSISPTNATADHGSSAVFIVTPDTGFVVTSVSGCGGSLTGSTYTTGQITASCEVAADFSTVAGLLNGGYKGVMVSPKNIFFTDSTNIVFAIDGYDANITKEAFFGRTCLLNGMLAGAAFPLTGLGTFQCSDFTEGTWSSSKIAKTNETASLSEIEMTAGSDVYTIKVAGFRGEPVANYDPALDFWIEGVDLADFVGIYDGNMQSLDSCAALAFSTSPSDLSVSINGNDILLQQDAFFEGVCRFEGVVDSFEEGVVAASGNYQCSNFDSGTWSTDRLVMTGGDSMFAELLVDVPTRGCAYTVKYLGFKAASGPPGSPGPPGPEEPVEPASLSLESCDLFGCQTVSLPFNQVKSASLTVVPTPEWYTLGEFRLSAGPEDIVISNIRAEVVSGNADAARILGLTEGVLTAGSQLVFELQSSRSTTSSTIEFAFDIDLVPGIPSTFFSSATVVTN